VSWQPRRPSSPPTLGVIDGFFFAAQKARFTNLPQDSGRPSGFDFRTIRSSQGDLADGEKDGYLHWQDGASACAFRDGGPTRRHGKEKPMLDVRRRGIITLHFRHRCFHSPTRWIE